MTSPPLEYPEICHLVSLTSPGNPYFSIFYSYSSLSLSVTITASAKEQITSLTDEIAQKFEDNVQQQEEITQLINMVVELQKKQKQVSILNS